MILYGWYGGLPPARPGERWSLTDRVVTALLVAAAWIFRRHGS